MDRINGVRSWFCASVNIFLVNPILVHRSHINKLNTYKSQNKNTTQPIFLLFSLLQHTTTAVALLTMFFCCVFWPAFRCLQHLNAGQTNFFSRFQRFLLILNLFQWFHSWNQQKTSENEQKNITATIFIVHFPSK